MDADALQNRKFLGKIKKIFEKKLLGGSLAALGPM